MTRALAADETLDLLALGRRIRPLRRERGLTLTALAAQVGRAAAQMSLIENGRREPRLAVLQATATALGVPLADLLSPEPPSRRRWSWPLSGRSAVRCTRPCACRRCA